MKGAFDMDNDQLATLSNSTRTAAMQLLLQVRALATLNKKAKAIDTALLDYRKLMSQNVQAENNKIERVGKIKRNQASIDTGVHNVVAEDDKIDQALNNIAQELTDIVKLPKSIAVNKKQLSYAVLSLHPDYATILPNIDGISKQIDTHTETNNYVDVQSDIENVRTALNTYIDAKQATVKNRQARLNELKELRDKLTKINVSLIALFDSLSDRIGQVDQNVREMSVYVNKITPVVLVESDDSILSDFANSERFGAQDKVAKQLEKVNAETDKTQSKDESTESEQTEDNDKPQVDVKPEVEKRVDTKKKKKHWWQF